jgi:hypothetical protein
MDAQHPISTSQHTQRSLYQRLVEGGSSDFLRAAYDVTRSIACDAGEEHGAAFDESELGRQVEALRSWARKENLLIKPEDLPPQNKGGREHYLTEPLVPSDRLIKVTIGPEFGFYPCCLPKARYRDVCHWFSTMEALPLQYLRRMLLLNELFPRCDTRLVGFVSRGTTLHAVTTQLIAQGRPAEDRHGELRGWFTSQGFVFISAWTWFRPSDGVALFDAMSKNVMRCDDGETVPFDVIPIRCEGTFLEMMHAAAERMA